MTLDPNLQKFEYGSRFLYAEDLLHNGEFKTVQVTIAEVFPPNTFQTDTKKKQDSKPITDWALRFEGKTKMLCIRSTNIRMLQLNIGSSNIFDAVGKKIKLQVRIVRSPQGGETLGIRILPTPKMTVPSRLLKQMGTEAIWSDMQQPPTEGATKHENQN